MLKIFSTAVFVIALTSTALGNANAANEIDERAANSRAAVKQFFGVLKGELVAGIKAGGPAHTIGICNEQAPAIADKISTEKGWSVARTSLKFRNPTNEPDNWERSVLENFEARKTAGENPAKMEHFEIVEMSGKKVFRYMKAIPTAEKPCLACHGEKISPEVEVKLSELYPDDTARGYKPGDIRGAFTITQPME
jgi:hypothetical protein